MSTPNDPSDRSVPHFPILKRGQGYRPEPVDAFFAAAASDGALERQPEDRASGAGSLRSADVRAVSFPMSKRGYDPAEVDAALSRLEETLAERERRTAMSQLGARAWVRGLRGDAQVLLERFQRPAGDRFERVSRWQWGYRRDEVDLVADKLADYFAQGTAVTPEQVRTAAFRMERGGYREVQVDAVLDAVIEVMLAIRG